MLYKCGFYETDITPPLGSVIPGGFAARYLEGILDKLQARAFCVQKDGRQAALLVLDVCGVTLDITKRIRQRVSDLTPIREQELMVMATHTHSGGPTLDWGEEVRRDETYLDHLVLKAADTVVLAWRNLAVASLETGSSELHDYSFIRIYRMQGNSLKTNPGMGNPDVVAPYTKIDPEVLVLLARHEGRPLGALVNFACHPAIVNGSLASGDYIAALAGEMKRIYGESFVTVFINGACGNINHVNVFDPATTAPGRERLLGRALAGACQVALEDSRPLVGPVQATTDSFWASLRKPDPERVKEAARQIYQSGWAEGQSRPGSPGYQETFFALEAMKIILDQRTGYAMQLQILKIGDLLIAGIPAQIFVEYGLRIKEAAKPAPAMVSAFANDYCGYVPVPECFVPGVYEARLAATSALVPETGEQLCACVKKMLRELI